MDVIIQTQSRKSNKYFKKPEKKNKYCFIKRNLLILKIWHQVPVRKFSNKSFHRLRRTNQDQETGLTRKIVPLKSFEILSGLKNREVAL